MIKLEEGFIPAKEGYFFPAEWEKHRATWLSWPHNKESWPGKIESIYDSYLRFIEILLQSEKVCLNVNDPLMEAEVRARLDEKGIPTDRITFYHHPTNDAWCRDHGPAFLLSRDRKEKIIVDWDYNAWGDKYPPYDLDDVIPTHIGKAINIPVCYPGIVMEGGSVDFNGAGTLLTTTACLLNPNRNPHLNQQQIEKYLRDYYGAEQILWLGEGIEGDDTDGHIDDLTRFVNEDTVVTVIEEDNRDYNYQVLQDNLKELKKMRLLNGKQLNIIELPMPDTIYHDGQRLPASYANFYISNGHVIVPTYRCAKDDVVLDRLKDCFPDREVTGIDSTDLIWGLGSFHCLSQQEPAVREDE